MLSLSPVQDIGLFSVFRGACHSLWLLWELALTGQPILVQGQHPELVSDAVMCIVGLISPVCYNGDFRPYFSLYDPDFKEVRPVGCSLVLPSCEHYEGLQSVLSVFPLSSSACGCVLLSCAMAPARAFRQQLSSAAPTRSWPSALSFGPTRCASPPLGTTTAV